MKEESNKKFYLEFILSAFPFLPFLSLIFINYSDHTLLYNQQLIPTYTKMSYFITSITLLGLFLKWYRFDWYFVWLGLSVFFASVFIIPFKEGILYWKFNIFSEFFAHNSMGLYKISITRIMIEIGLLILIFLGFNYILVKKFNLKAKRVIPILFSCYFSICNLLIVTFLEGYALTIDNNGFERLLKTFSIFNTLLSIVVLIILLNAKKALTKFLYIGIYLILILIIMSSSYLYLFYEYQDFKAKRYETVETETKSKTSTNEIPISFGSDFRKDFLNQFWIKPLVIIDALLILLSFSTIIFLGVRRLLKFPIARH